MTATPPGRTEALRALWETGRAAWPDLELPADTFIAWLDRRLPPEADPSQLMAADLYLVGACLLGVRDATRRFVEGHLAEAERHARRVVTPETSADLLQDLTVQLLTPGADGSPPRLAQYSGRGPLAVWLRMSVVRRALNAGRSEKKTVDMDALAETPSRHDPELSMLRRRHRDEIATIFREATAATSREERTLLRLHYVQGSTLDELAALHRTSRSTLHRRIEAARATLMTRISELVRQRMRVSDSERGSMLRIFQSDLRDTLGVLLREP